MKSFYREQDNYTYFLLDNQLMAAPTSADGSFSRDEGQLVDALEEEEILEIKGILIT